MEIKINGVIEKINEETPSISRLLEIRNVESPEMVSVQLNGQIVDQEDFNHRTVSQNDELEFLYFMGGGSR